MTHWALALYERYVQLYGEPIEQPINATQPLPDDATTRSRPAGDPQAKGSPARS